MIYIVVLYIFLMSNLMYSNAKITGCIPDKKKDYFLKMVYYIC
jgi:hypothetical protein